eukprot:m.198901 g.198901  ORF g.198901 m.198901 type:complete len:83 (+) comp20586_c0_seq1:54-302(+)
MVGGVGHIVRVGCTCFFFGLEALVHYNIGKTGSALPTVIPPLSESFLLVVSIIICSVTTEIAVAWIDKTFLLPAPKPIVKQE